ncbi:heavy-metal-associated domain-containing protein [Microvirga makkahensis]|uniref:HMA domain-containing protein n=1 Tax=Microvirga makkahensis TaxID=1128670 RepID=A0A7X3MWD2_9HYPH|nr:hypothetical protein [Microvirga makkahensis]
MHHVRVPGMTCGGCPGALTRAIQKLDQQALIESELERV